MILILTKEDDTTADYVGRRMKERGVNFHRVSLDSVAYKGWIEIDPAGCWRLWDGDKTLVSSDISAIWQRRIPQIRLESKKQEINEYITKEWRLVWEWWINSLPPEIILDPEWKLKRASNNISQLKIAKAVGLRTPETLITNSESAFQDFYDTQQPIIAKLLGGFGKVAESEQRFWTIYTNIVTPQDLKRAGSIKFVPAIFQRSVVKEYEIRVTAVGEQLFACKIDSQASGRTRVDWRRYDFHNVPHSKMSLPEDITEKLLTILRQFEIHFASFDLAVTPEGEYVFFEMNPNSQWVWIEVVTNLPITDALIDLLINKRFCSTGTNL